MKFSSCILVVFLFLALVGMGKSIANLHKNRKETLYGEMEKQKEIMKRCVGEGYFSTYVNYPHVEACINVLERAHKLGVY